MSAILLKILLIIAGVEQNPGPSIWLCSVCQQRIMRNTTSVQCTVCNNWCHLKRCSGLTSHRDWNPSFVGSCCSTQPQNPSTTPIITIPQSRVQTPPPGQNFVQSPTPGHSRPCSNQWTCSVCQDVIRRNITSIQCNGCKNWCHMRRCSGLRSHKDWSNSFLAPCCINIPPATVATPATPVQFTPHSVVQTPQHLPLLQQQTPARTPPQLPSILNIPPHQHHTRRPLHIGDSQVSFKIMQLNCNGLRNKVVEITNFMHVNNILIAAIQETKLTRDCRLSASSDYNIIRKDRERDHGGGLAFIIKRSVNYTLTVPPPSPSPNHYLEVMSISIKAGDIELEIVNVYIPPVNSNGSSYHPSIAHLLQGDNRIILGDFNAHHESWYSQLPNDPRGISISDQIAINEDFSMRITARCSSSPDI